MQRVLLLIGMTTMAAGLVVAAENEVETFYGYVDSDICAHLMLGPITEQRVECSKSTYEKGSSPVVVRLSSNTVYQVDRQKMVKDQVGGFAKVTGETQTKAGKIKLQSVEAVERQALAETAEGQELLDVRHYRADTRVYEQVRRTLAMMTYITDFDFISFTMTGEKVILTGWTIRITNRDEAYNRVKQIEGVGEIVNNIQVLPMGRNDMSIRAGARAVLQRYLPRYFWGNGSAIKIVVKNGDIILLGSVFSKGDSDMARIQCSQIPGSFHIFNLLKVKNEQEG